MAPRRIVTFNWVTADGYFAGADGNLDWVVPDEEQAKAASRSMKDATWGNSRLLRELDPREIETVKAQPGKDLIIYGSGSIVSQLTLHGLIDEYQFAVCPVLLGSGQSLIRGVSTRLRLDLLEVKRCPSGDVILRYARSTRVSPHEVM
jgi:dihydrofolate reductase